MDELYLCLNTDLTPHDLVRSTWEEVFEDWFLPATSATERGKILFGDFADDTKLDGRGKLMLPNEMEKGDLSVLAPEGSDDDKLEAILTYLDELCDQWNDESEGSEVSVVGSVPSGFRVKFGDQWRPRMAPSFVFSGGQSSFEITLFDVSWILDKDDLATFIQRLKQLVDLLGERRVTQIEWTSSGEFERNDDVWRSLFEDLPIASKEFR